MITYKWLGGGVGGIRFSMPTILVASGGFAQSINPCPRIYYEEPFNSSRSVPQGCPPNAATQELINQGRLPASQPAQSGVTTPAPGTSSSNTPASNTPAVGVPLPETQRNAIASVTPDAGTVDIQMTNTTNTTVTYQVVGQTETRSLGAQQTVLLQDIPPPTTINLVRPDGGFVQVVPQTTTEAGILSVALNAAADLDLGNRTLQINESGQVFAF